MRGGNITVVLLTNHLYVQLLNIFKYYCVIKYYTVESRGSVRGCVETVTQNMRHGSSGTKNPRIVYVSNTGFTDFPLL